MPTIPDHRFEALDSWRGICACAVAMFHFPGYSQVHELALVRHADLFVDFFFVLSGFVIASAYERRLTQGGGLREFVLLRIGRVYPLHLFMLAVYVAFELLYALPNGGSAHGAPFDGDRSPGAIVTNVLLVHSLHVYDHLTWNLPSWSISTEFYTYLIFGAVATWGAARLRVVGIALMLLCPALLWWTTTMLGGANTYDFGLIRCVYGFACGVACLHAFRAIEAAAPRSAGVATALELLAVFAVGLFVARATPVVAATLAPVAFSVAVLVFSLERGALSALLKRRPMLALGALSYSIYMVHLFVQQGLIVEGLVVLQQHAGIMLLVPVNFGSSMTLFVGTSPWMGTLAYLVMLVLVIGVSALTYRFVELPARAAFRRFAARRAPRVPLVVGALAP